MQTRRHFLQTAAATCGGCLGVGSFAPHWWSKVAAAAEPTAAARRLIVIELTGGNDGLNTVIPYADDLYYKARPTLGIAAKEVFKLNDHLGLHPAMKPWQKFWDAGNLAIVENCGYPKPNRSHFESMDIWHAGQLDATVASGWLGRAADDAASGETCFVGEGGVPHALSRRLRSVAALEKLDDLRLKPAVAELSLGPSDGDDLAATINARLLAARELSTRLAGVASPTIDPLAAERPLADRLTVIRTLMEQDQPYRVYYTSQGGFDTHSSQRGTHEDLLERTTEAVAGFLTQLRERKLDQGVTIFLFSEFGRRVRENGSLGTDHGAAAPVLILGDRVKGGLQGGVPNLSDLDDGDLRHKIDFRDVYASLLADGLGVDPAVVLGPRENRLQLFAQT